MKTLAELKADPSTCNMTALGKQMMVQYGLTPTGAFLIDAALVGGILAHYNGQEPAAGLWVSHLYEYIAELESNLADKRNNG